MDFSYEFLILYDNITMATNKTIVHAIPASGPKEPPVNKSEPTNFNFIKLPTSVFIPLTSNPKIFP